MLSSSNERARNGTSEEMGPKDTSCPDLEPTLFENGLRCTHAHVRHSCLSCLHCATTDNT